MHFRFTRRGFLMGAAAAVSPWQAAVAGAPAKARLDALERRHGGRLGVVALDTGTGARLEYRPDERFPMCSTFKLLLVAEVLERVDRREEQLDRRIPYGPADIETYAPVAKRHLADGAMTVGALCAAAIEWSDNTAANLLLKIVGGPPGFTRYVRGLGDPTTRLDRAEPVGTAIPGDVRDTTTPRLMVQDMKTVFFGRRLSDDSLNLLGRLLVGDKVGAGRLRAGLPRDWRIGDKTGTGDHGTANDIAILWPPKRAPILVSAYYTESPASRAAQNAVLADVGRIVATAF
jgi:beta-lactamase class A